MSDDPYWPTISSTGAITTVPMTQAQERAAGKRKRERPPFGFGRALTDRPKRRKRK